MPLRSSEVLESHMLLQVKLHTKQTNKAHFEIYHAVAVLVEDPEDLVDEHLSVANWQN